MRVGGHFFIGAAVDHGHAFRTQPFGNGGAINRRIPGADHHHVTTDFHGGGVDLALFNIIEPIHNAFFAWNIQGRRCPQAHAKKYCIKILLKICERKIATQVKPRFHLDA